MRYKLIRYAMYERLWEVFPEGITGKVLGISGVPHLRPFFTEETRLTVTSYPEVDMMDMPYEDETFDYVISDQILEHLEDPFQAVQESHRVLKTGALAVHTSCMINYYHPCPVDLWRFTTDGLRLLCRDFDEIIECDGWGNRIAIFLYFLNWRFRYMDIPDNPVSLRHRLAMYNEPEYHMSTWIIARK